MVLGKKTCAYSGCNTFRSFAVEGSKKAEFCSFHAAPGMVNVCGRKCTHPGCSTTPTYGEAGSNKGKFCVVHARQV